MTPLVLLGEVLHSALVVTTCDVGLVRAHACRPAPDVLHVRLGLAMHEMANAVLAAAMRYAAAGGPSVDLRTPGDREGAGGECGEGVVVIEATFDVGVQGSGARDGDGLDAALEPARRELASGDRRVLHLLWLAAVQFGRVDDDEREPPPPAGLGRASLAQQALAEVLDLSPDLVTASVEASPHGVVRTAGHLLGREAVLASDRRASAREAQRRQARQWLACLPEVDAAWVLAQVRGASSPLLWRQIEASVVRGDRVGYRRAAALLAHLAEGAAGDDDATASFDLRLAAVRHRHAGRGAFLATLSRAGLAAGG